MPYFLLLKERKVIYRPATGANFGELLIDPALVTSCNLKADQVLTGDQIEALKNRSPGAFAQATHPDSAAGPSPARRPPTPAPAASSNPPAALKQPAPLLPVASAAFTSGAGRRALYAARTAEIIAWILGVLGIILSVVVMFQKEYTEWEGVTRPYIGLGVGLLLASVFQAGLLIMTAAFIQWRLIQPSHQQQTPP